MKLREICVVIQLFAGRPPGRLALRAFAVHCAREYRREHRLGEFAP